MPETKTPHVNDFTLLRYVAFDLDEAEHAKVADHVEACPACQTTLREIEALDQELTALAKTPSARAQWETEELPEGDPFRVRPRVSTSPRVRPADAAEFAARAVAASETGAALADSILRAARTSVKDLEAELSRLSLSDAAHRFGLLYALQSAGTGIAESPTRALVFGERSLAILRALPDGAFPGSELVPDAAIFAQAHQLVGQACLWTGELERAGSCFSLAYRFFERLGDELGLAKIEQLESQRRFFAGNGSQALVLASRARRTAEQFGVEEEAARCRVAEGMALFALAQWPASVEAFRAALPVFEKLELWSNYVGALNCIGNALVKLNQLDEARREYARALRRLSREQHRSWLPFIRKGLAEILFSADRFREAAVAASQAARLYGASGQISRSLMALLFEAESWARAGDIPRARHRLDLFQAEIASRGSLDPTFAKLIASALSGSSPDFQKLSQLKDLAGATLKQQFGEMPA